MTFVSVLLTILLIVVVPGLVGSIFSLSGRGFIAEGLKDESGLKRMSGIFMWSWFLGQLLLWCIFQLISVEKIINRKQFTIIEREYTVIIAVLCLAAVVVNTVRYVRRNGLALVKAAGADKEAMPADRDRLIMVSWVVFGVLLIIQTVLQFVLAYKDVDDAFYVGEAVAINSSDYMYTVIPYTGLPIDMDFRHSLEPFPAWIAYIARISGANVTALAHTLLPGLLLPLTYGTYALMGSRLLGDKKRNLPVYLIAVELLVMFSLYSPKTPEKFLITRIRQGKSALASLIIPGIIMCLFLILQYAKENKRTDIRLWIMLFMLNTAGCLCSTMGALLCLIPVAIVAIMMIFAYKKGWHLIPMILGCAPCLIYALIYLIKG